MKSSVDSPMSDSILAVRIPDKNNSHEMQSIQAPETFNSIPLPSPSTRASGQPTVANKEATPVSHLIFTERKENGKEKSPMKHGLANSTSEASLLGEANVLGSVTAKSANLSRTGFQTSKTGRSSKRDNILPPAPEAALPRIASTAEPETGKESNAVSKPEHCFPKTIGTEMTRVSASGGNKPVQMASERVKIQLSLLRESTETLGDGRSLHRAQEDASKNLKRSAELSLPSVSKITKFDNRAFTTERSASSEIVAPCTARQTSEDIDFLCIQNKKSVAAGPLPHRHPKFASSTNEYPRGSSFTTPDVSGMMSTMAHHTSKRTVDVQNREQKTMEPSSQIRATPLLLAPKNPSLINITPKPAVKKTIGPSPVSKKDIAPKSHSHLACVGRRDIPRGERFENQASLTRTIASPSNGSLVNQNRAGENAVTGEGLHHQDLPEKTTSALKPRHVKTSSVCTRPPVSRSSASKVVQSKQVDPQLHRTNGQNISSTIVERHATEFKTIKNKISTTSIQTIRTVTNSKMTSAVREGSENVSFDQKGWVVPAMVQRQIARRSGVEKKQDNTHFVQRRVGYNLYGNLQGCEKQSLTVPITQSATDLRVELHKKQRSVSPTYVKRSGPTMMRSRNSSPKEKSAAPKDHNAAVKRLNTDSAIPALPPMQPLRSPKDLTKGSTAPQATRVISHHSTADKRTQPMRATSIVKEDRFLRIDGTGKARGSIGSSPPPMAQAPLLSHLRKSEKQLETNRHSNTRKMVSAIEKENAKQTALSSTQQGALAGKQKSILQSAHFEPKDSPEITKDDEMSASQTGRRDMSIVTDKNGTMTIASMTGAHHKTPNTIANQLVNNTSPGNRGSCPRANGNNEEPASSSSAGDTGDHIERLIVVELPYGSPRTIKLKEEDMVKHIPVWNTKLKYKVAGTAAPLGKNIARYLDRKMGEFEVYNQQEKYESEHTRKNVRVTLWHKIEKRKISGTSAPLRKNIERYLREHPHCEAYVDQQSRLDSRDRKTANARVMVWNKNSCRKQGFGQSGPLRKNLKRYLLQHPHLEEYVGQDVVKTAVSPTEDEQETKVAEEEDNSDSQAHHNTCQPFVDSEHQEGRKQNATEDDGCGSENLCAGVQEKLEPFLLDPIEELDSGVEGCNSAELDGGPIPLDMSSIPDLNILPFDCERADMELLDLDEHSFLSPGHEGQLDDLSDFGKDASVLESEMGTYFHDDVEAEWRDNFVGEVAPGQLDVKESCGDHSEPLQVALEPLDNLDVYPDLELDNVF